MVASYPAMNLYKIALLPNVFRSFILGACILREQWLTDGEVGRALQCMI